MQKVRSIAANLSRNRLFLAVVSVIVSFFVWLYVANVENKDITTQITGIDVIYEGADLLLVNNEYVVTEKPTSVVTLEIRGKRSIVSRLGRSNLSVTVDLSTIRSIGEVVCPYTVNIPDSTQRNALLISGDPEFVVVGVERIISREFPVRGILDGSVAVGYVAEKPVLTPATITVKGPNSIVSQIDHAQVSLVGEQLTESTAKKLTPLLVDADGNEIDPTELTLDYTTVTFEQPIKMLKDVTLTVNLISGGGADATLNASVEVVPKTVQLKGDSATLQELNLLALSTLDLAQISGRYVETYAIPLPDGVESVSGETTAEVTITIFGLVSTNRVASRFEVVNAASGHKVTVTTPLLPVIIRGPSDDVNEVPDDAIVVTCDVSDIASTSGTHTLAPEDITVTVQGYPNVGVIKNYRGVTVTVD